jgi:nucleotide-binding universal stress UspA family protein
MAPLRKVLLAVAGREDADTAIRFFMNTPFRHPVEVAVLAVLPLSQSRWIERTDALRNMMLRSAHRFVEDVAARLSKAQCCAIPVTKVGTPAAAILQHAEELQPDLIMIGSHTGTSVSRFLLGSVSHKILHASRRPVLTLR